MRCEGYRRNGGAFTYGPVKWVQCPKNAVVNLTVTQGKETKTFPSCQECWKEATECRQIAVVKAEPI